MPPIISIIVAMDRRRLIGAGGRLPWHLPADLQHFKRTTLGKPVIMGRKTYESIGRPLPDRTNIVVTRNEHYEAPGCTLARSLDHAIRSGGDGAELMIIGGGDLYRQALPLATRIYLTRVDAEFDGDTWFPELDEKRWSVREEIRHVADERNPFPYSFSILERVPD